MVLEMETFCSGLVSSMDDQPTISEIMHKAIAERTFPGGAVAFGSCTVPCYYQAYGTYTFESSRAITPESQWDMASLTKIMATVPSIMILYDRGQIALEEVVCKYLPEFGNNGKEFITVRQLLTHTAGLREFYPFFDMGLRQKDQVLEYIMADKVWYSKGITRYSDLSTIVLGLVVERITGMPLEVFVAKEIYEPLGMRSTYFRPIDKVDFNPLVVPTEVDRMHRNRLLWGEVHDPSAFVLGGVAGHAGLFSTISDVCRFAQTMLAGGMDQTTGRRLFKESTVRIFTTPGLKTPNNPRPFALGWDAAVRRSMDGYTSAGKYLGSRTFGHTGFTGTSLWIDPDRNLFVALLTNAVHPTSVGGFGYKVREVRPMIADAAVHAMGEQAIPRESLTWHLGSTLIAEEKKFLALKDAQSTLLSTDDDMLHWALPEHLTTTSVTALQPSPSSEPCGTRGSNQVAQVTFASMTTSVVMAQNISNESAEKHIEWRRLVPIICIALVLYLWSGPLITFWYPLVASFMAIGSSNNTDDKLWITYWMLYSLVSTLELIVGWTVIGWIPFYSTIKLVIASWLVLPQFQGALVFYEEVVRPNFNFCFGIGTEVTFTDGERKWSAYISPDTNASAALYLQKNGPDAFEALMKLATKSIKVEEAVKVEEIEEVEDIKL